jgi:hypothetical protein
VAAIRDRRTLYSGRSDRGRAKIRIDFVRLTVDPGPFLQMKGERRDALDTILRSAIRRFRARDLSVIVNFHSNSQVAQYRPEAIFTDAQNPLFLAYATAVSRTARLIAEMKDPNVALEPVNEPPAGYDSATAARWQTMMEQLYRAARQQAPDLTLILTGAQGAVGAVSFCWIPRRFAMSMFFSHFIITSPIF